MFIISAFCATAYDNKIITDSVTTKNNRIFEVPVGISSEKTMTAGTFTLSYDTSDVEFRGVSALTPDSRVKAVDRKGETTVIFVCADGVSLKDEPYLFAVKYKKISEKNSDIKISVSDCVDGDVKNFSAPDSAVCKVKYSPNASTTSKYTRKSKKTSSSTKSKSKSQSQNDDIFGDEYFDNDDEQGSVPIINTTTGSNSYPFVLAAVIIAALFASSLCAAIIIRSEKSKKTNEKDDNK
ncbi:MAG: hypothetical protein J1E96_00060 [Ruminococcus sp.]|nr:hypothetical protein [Ruminococcus sp.]